MKHIMLIAITFLFCMNIKAQDHSADSMAIINLVKQYEDTWNNNDMDAHCKLFTEDGSWITIGGFYWKDRNEVSTGTHALAPAFKNMIPMKLNIQRMQFVDEKVAVLFLLEDIYINSDWNYPDGSIGGKKGEHDYGQMSWVVVKDNGEWKLKAGQNTTVDQKMKQFNPVK